ncbi:MAG: hypothetical protein K0S85_4875, partial [Pseudomonas orientalis]|nr:hypothetical protein [Pseudomonas orientalis]
MQRRMTYIVIGWLLNRRKNVSQHVSQFDAAAEYELTQCPGYQHCHLQQLQQGTRRVSGAPAQPAQHYPAQADKAQRRDHQRPQ